MKVLERGVGVHLVEHVIQQLHQTATKLLEGEVPLSAPRDDDTPKRNKAKRMARLEKEGKEHDARGVLPIPMSVGDDVKLGDVVVLGQLLHVQTVLSSCVMTHKHQQPGRTAHKWRGRALT